MYTEYVMGKKVVQKQEEPSLRFEPLRILPFGSAVRGHCQDCNLERLEYVSVLVKQGRMANRTAADLGEILGCSRQGCGGEMTFDVDLAD